MIRTIRILLTVVFGWSLLKMIEVMVRGTSMDQLILNKSGLGPLFWLLLPAVSLTTLGAILFIWFPRPLLYRFAQASVLLGIVETCLVSGLSASNPAMAKEAFVASRISRGLPVPEEVTSFMEHPMAHLVPVAFVVFFGVIWLYLFWLLKRSNLAPASP